MDGKIKFYNHEKKYGFIVPDGGGEDLFFHISMVTDGALPLDPDIEVVFSVAEHKGKLQAQEIRAKSPIVNRPNRTELTGKPGTFLDSWAFIPFDNFTSPAGVQYESAIDKLAEFALDEDWDFGVGDGMRRNEILRSYLKYTFARLWREGKVAEHVGQTESWAAFNTGLVNETFDPIFALFDKNPAPSKPCRFHAFCIPGIKPAGKKLTSIFSPLPKPPQYFNEPSDVLFDTEAEIHPQFDHIVFDGIARDRFPEAFIEDNLPRVIDREELRLLNGSNRKQFLERLAKEIQDDPQCFRAINNRIRDAIELAQKRARWNYKTAIPHYFPTRDEMSLLLPLALVDDNEVDIALVVKRQPSGAYNASTVLPLSWAYKNARLVCRPDSDWLTTGSVSEVSSEFESDED